MYLTGTVAQRVGDEDGGDRHLTDHDFQSCHFPAVQVNVIVYDQDQDRGRQMSRKG